MLYAVGNSDTFCVSPMAMNIIDPTYFSKVTASRDNVDQS